MTVKNFDPLLSFLEKKDVDLLSIDDFIIGGKYVCIVLKDGKIGLAANILNVKYFDFKNAELFDVKNYTHRLFLTAYFNAHLNSGKTGSLEGDIFKLVDFKQYKKIVMIGYSIPMYKKMQQLNIEPIVFDYAYDESFITEQHLMPKKLNDADALILTGTTIINNTFHEILNNVNAGCDVFLIGPSVPVTEEMFDNGIKGIFGTIFEENKDIVMDLIKENKGTDYLKKYGKKVALLKK